MTMGWLQGLYTQIKIWQRLEQVGVFGQRQSTSCVGGISAKHWGDAWRETYPPRCIILSRQNASMVLSTSHSDPMAALTRMTLREVFLGWSVSKKYKTQMIYLPVSTPTPSRFASRCVLLGILQGRGTTWVEPHLYVVVPICWVAFISTQLNAHRLSNQQPMPTVQNLQFEFLLLRWIINLDQ